ncbi:MAG: hypothetical protein A2Z29_04860 [Chloroflexi bacterium RBG_16_56_11]|nr:MAG: hypothetical protein A2Z29_04860 [Chloroflexi bacterium RBG_16_56_11]
MMDPRESGNPENCERKQREEKNWIPTFVGMVNREMKINNHYGRSRNPGEGKEWILTYVRMT